MHWTVELSVFGTLVRMLPVKECYLNVYKNIELGINIAKLHYKYICSDYNTKKLTMHSLYYFCFHIQFTLSNWLSFQFKSAYIF